MSKKKVSTCLFSCPDPSAPELVDMRLGLKQCNAASNRGERAYFEKENLRGTTPVYMTTRTTWDATCVGF